MGGLAGVVSLAVMLLGLGLTGSCVTGPTIDWSLTLGVGVVLVVAGLGRIFWSLRSRPPQLITHGDGTVTITHERLAPNPTLSRGLAVGGLLPLGYSLLWWLAYNFERHRPTRPYDPYLLDVAGLTMLAVGLASWNWESLEMTFTPQTLRWRGQEWAWTDLRTVESVGGQLWLTPRVGGAELLEWEPAVVARLEAELKQRLTPPLSDWSY